MHLPSAALLCALAACVRPPPPALATENVAVAVFREVRLRGTVAFPEMVAAHALGRKVAVPLWQQSHGADGAAAAGAPAHDLTRDVADFRVRSVAAPLFDAAPECDWCEGGGIAEGVQVRTPPSGQDEAGVGRFEVILPVPESAVSESDANPGCQLPGPEAFHYELIISAGRVDLRRSLTLKEVQDIMQGQGILPVVDLRSTVEAEFARQLGPEIPADASLVDAATEQLAALLRTEGYGRRAPRSVVAGLLVANDEGGGAGPLAGVSGRRRLFSTTPCSASGSAGSTICYDANDFVVYNLVQEIDIFVGTTPMVNRWGVSFNTYPGTILRWQYSAQGVVFQPIRGGFFGGFFGRPWRVRERVGYATLEPPRFSRRGGGVRIVFSNPNQLIHSFGFNLVNGPDYNAPLVVHPRRAFRVTMYDRTHTEIHQYRWFLANQAPGGNNFYGATMGMASASSIKFWGPIAYIEITFEDNGPAAIADLWYSSVNVAHHINAGGSGTGPSYSLNDNLGWRGEGLWEKLSSATSTYQHPYYGYANRSPAGSSGGTYWNCPYGTKVGGDYLTSPAFTLTNLPVWDGKDDDPSMWMVGIAAASASHSINSDYRIPSNIPPASAPACVCTGAEWCCYLQTDLFTFGESSATMHNHWSHAHFSSSADIDSSWISTNDPSGNTERWVEYSMDNGKTWVNLFWWEDTNHRGSNANWHQNHMHAFADSDMTNEVYGTDFNGDSTVTGTDFDKDGTDDYLTPGEDWNLDGTPDAADAREWDTEFYLRWVNNPASTGTVSGYYTTARSTHGGTTYQFKVSDLEAPSIMYRFRFVGIQTPGTCPVSCAGWSIDDVSFSNDEPTQGYYTNFDGSYDSSFS